MVIQNIIKNIMADGIIQIFFGVMLTVCVMSILANGGIIKSLQKKSNELKTGNPKELPKELLAQLAMYQEENTYGVVNAQTVVEAYISEGGGGRTNRWVKCIKGIPSQLIIMGVLGTFIGLVAGLSGIDIQKLRQMEEVSQQMDIGDILGLLEGIHTAFYTSIAGIVLCLLLQVVFSICNSESALMKYMLRLEMNVNKCIEDKQAKETAQRMIQMNQNILKISTELHAVTELENAAKGLEAFNVNFGNNIQELIGVLGIAAGQMSQFSGDVTQLSGKFEGLIHEFDRHNQVNQQMINCVAATYESIKSSVAIQQELKDNTQQMFKEERESLKYVEDEIRDTFMKITGQQEEQVHKMEELYEVDKKRLTMQEEQLLQMKETLLQGIATQFATIAAEYTKAMEQVDEHLKEIGEDYHVSAEKLGEQVSEMNKETTQEIATHLQTFLGQQQQAGEKLQATWDQVASHYNEIVTTFQETLQAVGEEIAAARHHEQLQYQQITTHFEASDAILIKLTQTYSEMDKHQQQINEMIHKLANDLLQYTERTDLGFEKKLNAILGGMKKNTEMINGRIQEMMNDKLKKQFIKAYYEINGDKE